MAEAYVGPGVDRITYYGVLYQLCGRYIGEVPDFCMEAFGNSILEVKGTLQGLVEEEVESLIEEDKPFPEPDFQGTKSHGLPKSAEDIQQAAFSIIVPSTVSRDLLTTFDEYPAMHSATDIKLLEYKAVIQRMPHFGYGGHFPDLPGAFTSGRSIEETGNRLQPLLEAYIGQLLQSGQPVPSPSFDSDVALTGPNREEDSAETVLACSVQIPQD